MTTHMPDDGTIGTETLSDSEALQALQEELEHVPMPEARGIAWADLQGIARDAKTGEFHIVRVNVTERSAVGSKQALMHLMDTLRFAKETYHLTPYAPSFPQAPKKEREAPEKQTPAPEAPAAPAKSKPAPAQAPAPAIEAGKSESVKCIKIEVVPLPDDRVTLKFYDDNPRHKFPVLFVTNWTTGDAVKLLESVPFTGKDGEFYEISPEVLSRACMLPVSVQVDYTVSDKVNNAGNHYKDVTKVYPV